MSACKRGHNEERKTNGACWRCSKAQGRWRQMILRCTDPNDSHWSYYGGRGITVDPRWLDFDHFYADTGDPPEGMSLDRIDNNGNYEPGNVRWATPKQQAANRPAVVNGNARKTACIHGHPFDEANTYTRLQRVGRTCKACNRLMSARSRRRRNQSRTVVDAERYERAHAAEDNWPLNLGDRPAGWSVYDEVPTAAELEP